jgi:hypothetical protein
MAFGSKTAASKSMLNVDVQSKGGSLAVSEEVKGAVATRKLLLHLAPWVLEALLQEVQALEAGLVAEGGAAAAASEADSNHAEAMEAGAVVELASREVVASEGKTVTGLPLQMLQQAQVELVVVEVASLEVGEGTVDHPAHQIVTALVVGMIRVVEVARMMTEVVGAGADIVATNVMDLHAVVLEATWSR